uniref:Protein FAM96B n=1 Tax=Solanum tuberosum TaxID=4113 RepID=M1AJG7_SOLTU
MLKEKPLIRLDLHTPKQKLHHAYDGARHSSTMSTRLGFSNAAATRSLSFNCLFTASR